jgi:hypothetical protein
LNSSSGAAKKKKKKQAKKRRRLDKEFKIRSALPVLIPNRHGNMMAFLIKCVTHKVNIGNFYFLKER